MAIARDTHPGRAPRLVISEDVAISEKRGMSRARDPKTGRLLSDGDGTVRSQQTSGLRRWFKK
jgi:hypothetical protein